MVFPPRFDAIKLSNVTLALNSVVSFIVSLFAVRAAVTSIVLHSIFRALAVYASVETVNFPVVLTVPVESGSILEISKLLVLSLSVKIPVSPVTFSLAPVSKLISFTETEDEISGR